MMRLPLQRHYDTKCHSIYYSFGSISGSSSGSISGSSSGSSSSSRSSSTKTILLNLLLLALLVFLNTCQLTQALSSSSSKKSGACTSSTNKNTNKNTNTNTNNHLPKFTYAQHLKTKIASSEAKCERRRIERSQSSSPREVCPNCHRVPILCICSSLPLTKICTDTTILVLQHPNEYKRKSLSTVPIMPLVLEDCTVVRGYNFGEKGGDKGCRYQGSASAQSVPMRMVEDFVARGKVPLLLFPSPDAISLDDSSDGDVRVILNKLSNGNGYGNGNRNGNGKSETKNNNDNKNGQGGSDVYVNVDADVSRKVEAEATTETKIKKDGHLLILVDGTWAEARRIIMQSPTLVKQCQMVQFSLEYTSIYDIVRKEPDKHCISTLEACAQALLRIESDETIAMKAKECLERSMRHMVDTKRKIYEMRNAPEPRFTRPGMKEAKRTERAKEVEKTIFGVGGGKSTSSITNTDTNANTNKVD